MLAFICNDEAPEVLKNLLLDAVEHVERLCPNAVPLGMKLKQRHFVAGVPKSSRSVSENLSAQTFESEKSGGSGWLALFFEIVWDPEPRVVERLHTHIAP